ncbi:MAG TPA: DUF1684 domain-containing protein [Opitutaceae bacterium]|nr:DUF1684 domain-containing protein [Opitutaceae bacterium]
MTLRRAAFLAWCTAAALLAAGSPAGDAYVHEIEAARADRVARLTAPDGWLTLVGLHFLHAGANTVGAEPDNDVVLERAPPRLGVAAVAPDGKLSFALAPHAVARIDGRDVRTAELRSDETGEPTRVTFGTVTFFAIDRGGRKALRVKDSAAERRTRFRGLDYFPIDPAWRIEARWEPFEKSRLLPVANILGQVAPEPVSGKAVFERDGQKFELLPIDEGPDEPLFFVIADATSGKETYAASRFLYAERPRNGKVVLDFNRAQNPPCAFTPFATCPLPPKENRLPFAVTAGEKTYRGAHE